MAAVKAPPRQGWRARLLRAASAAAARCPSSVCTGSTAATRPLPTAGHAPAQTRLKEVPTAARAAVPAGAQMLPCSAWQAEVLHQHSPRLLLLLAKLFQTLAPLSLAQWKGAACFTLEARRCQLPPRRLPTLWLQRLCLHHSLRGLQPAKRQHAHLALQPQPRLKQRESQADALGARVRRTCSAAVPPPAAVHPRFREQPAAPTGDALVQQPRRAGCPSCSPRPLTASSRSESSGSPSSCSPAPSPAAASPLQPAKLPAQNKMAGTGSGRR